MRKNKLLLTSAVITSPRSTTDVLIVLLNFFTELFRGHSSSSYCRYDVQTAGCRQGSGIIHQTAPQRQSGERSNMLVSTQFKLQCFLP